MNEYAGTLITYALNLMLRHSNIEEKGKEKGE